MKKVIIVSFVYSICSCAGPNNVESYISEEFRACHLQNDSGPCEINFGELYDGNWDKLYVFGSSTDPEFVKSIIGTTGPGGLVPQGKLRLIFIRDSTIIVDYVDCQSGGEGGIQFHRHRSKNHQQTYFNKSEAIFRVETAKTIEGKEFYRLIQLEP